MGRADYVRIEPFPCINCGARITEVRSLYDEHWSFVAAAGVSVMCVHCSALMIVQAVPDLLLPGITHAWVTRATAQDVDRLEKTAERLRERDREEKRRRARNDRIARWVESQAQPIPEKKPRRKTPEPSKPSKPIKDPEPERRRAPVRGFDRSSIRAYIRRDMRMTSMPLGQPLEPGPYYGQCSRKPALDYYDRLDYYDEQ